MAESNIKLSVIIFTYNHADFIKDTLLGILNQQVDFKYEIIISDDLSIDNTIEIVNQYQTKYPEIIKVLKSEKNGILKNSLRVVEHIRGEYIAHIDGDDYWIYEGKLQKQIDFLDQNSDFNGVFHDALINHEDEAEKLLFTNKKSYSQVYNYPKIIFPSDLINRLILPTASAVVRTKCLQNIDFSKLHDFYSLDWKMNCFAIKSSKFYFINETWSVYRNHMQGVSKKEGDKYCFSNILFLRELLDDEFYKDYKYEIYKSISNEYALLLNMGIEINYKKVYRQYLLNEIKRVLLLRKIIQKK